MQTYVITRRKFWNRPEDLEKSASISARIGTEEMADQVKWIRSYVVEEEHARRVGMPADEVMPVGDLVVVNEDPARS